MHSAPELHRLDLQPIVETALREDIGFGDITTVATVLKDTRAIGIIEANGDGIVAGLPVVVEVFRQLDPTIIVEALRTDGQVVAPGDTIARLVGSARHLLTGERVALNFLQRLSGIATLTNRYVREVSGTRARITDTRKTTPGLRVLEKYAVRVGGGHNHRMDLNHAVMIKDNHIVAAGSISEAVARVIGSIGHTMTIVVECETIEHVYEALDSGADILLLDNMPLDLLALSVRSIAGRAITEASGSITLGNVSEVAATGVEYISIGALTHSAPSMDIRLNIELSE